MGTKCKISWRKWDSRKGLFRFSNYFARDLREYESIIQSESRFRCKTISLGRGQYGLASKHLVDAMAHGNWIVLENCHLDIDLTLRLGVEYRCAVDAENVLDEFRLWCVTAPTSQFPIAVLRQAVKFTCNPPNTLKGRITRHVAHLNDEKHLRWSFALVTFHAVLQERREFGTIGWNRPYSFKDHSLKQAMIYLNLIMKNVEDPTALDGIKYMVTECIYGGLVVDHVDRRLLRSLFQQICCDSTERFFENASICVPAELTGDNCVKAIEVLSSRETNAVDVGLHANAEFERGFRQSDYTLATLSPSEPAEGGDPSGNSVKTICNDILTRLPAPLPSNSITNPDDTFGLIRRYETMHFNRLLQCMRATLTELRQAIDGDVHMIDDLHQIYRSLQSNRIPCAWLPFMYRTSKSLASFVSDLGTCVELFRGWDSDKPPRRFRFAAFYNPEALVTGMRAAYAIANGIDLTDVRIQCNVLDENTRNESILIEVSSRFSQFRFSPILIFVCPFAQGLYIQGARWNLDSNCLDEALPRQFFAAMPTIELRPVAEQPKDGPDAEIDATEYHYNAPVFHTVHQTNAQQYGGPSASNFVMFLDLKSHQSPTHWINRSTAIYCQLPE